MSKFFRCLAPFIIALSLLSIIYISCSDGTVTYTSSSPTPASVDKYFPLEQGVSANYTITDNWDEIVAHRNFTIAAPVTLNGQAHYRGIYVNMEYPALRDTGYFYIDGTSLYYYDDYQASPEKILEGPLTIGKSWQRFAAAETASGQNNLIYILTEGKGGKYDDSSLVSDDETDGDDGATGGAALKYFPSSGANYFRIGAIENIELKDGNTFENCVRVENKSGQYTNYYWYAPEAGLVRYVINATDDTYPDGQVVGEIYSASPLN